MKPNEMKDSNADTKHKRGKIKPAIQMKLIKKTECAHGNSMR